MTPLSSVATTASWKQDFRFDAIGLNPDLQNQVEATLAAEKDQQIDAQLSTHWTLRDDTLTRPLAELVHWVRGVHAAAGVIDPRTDQQLIARILDSMGLWDIPQPKGNWGRARFMARFLAGYGRLVMKAAWHQGTGARYIYSAATLDRVRLQ
jgi:hypothetical protein